jgi:hypothetical protein
MEYCNAPLPNLRLMAFDTMSRWRLCWHLTRKCASYLVAENGGVKSKKPHYFTLHIADSKHSIFFLAILMMLKYLTSNIPKSVRRTSSRVKASKAFFTAPKIWMLPGSRFQSRWRLWQATCSGHHTSLGMNLGHSMRVYVGYSMRVWI